MLDIAAATLGAGAISGAAGIGGALINSRATRQANNANMAMQKEFAQNGIRWKVEDAKAAGIHPLYAIGANTNSPTLAVMPDTSLGTAVANMGQDISRAIVAGQTEEERMEYLLKMKLLNSQINETDARAGYYTANAARALGNPVLPSVPAAGAVKHTPDERISNDPRDPSKTAADRKPAWMRYEIFPGIQWDFLSNSGDLGESMEGFMPAAMSMIRNLIARPAMWGDKKLRRGLDEGLRYNVGAGRRQGNVMPSDGLYTRGSK